MLPPTRMLTDERLALLAGAGDDHAFAQLYARHENALLGYCRSITRDSEDARDALQTAMASAYTSLASRPAGAPARAWLFRIAHNESVNVLRRRRPDLPLLDGDHAAASAADQTLERETAHEVLAEVARLPVRQRGALVLRELQGLDYDEIASTLSISEGTARQLVFAARSGIQESRAGRRLPCELVRDVIEVGDRRAQRRRGMRAHLRSCRDCRDYARACSPQRRRAALTLPGWLTGWSGLAAQTAGGGATPMTAGAGEMLGSMTAKGVAFVAVAALAAGASSVPQHSAQRKAQPEPRAAVSSPKTSSVAVRANTSLVRTAAPATNSLAVRLGGVATPRPAAAQPRIHREASRDRERIAERPNRVADRPNRVDSRRQPDRVDSRRRPDRVASQEQSRDGWTHDRQGDGGYRDGGGDRYAARGTHDGRRWGGSSHQGDWSETQSDVVQPQPSGGDAGSLPASPDSPS